MTQISPIQAAYWQRLRQEQVYRAYAATGSLGGSRVPYDTIRKVSDNWFLNYVEYDAKNISPDKANEAFMTQTAFSFLTPTGMCTGVHKGSMQLRQLDWYFNEEAEFVIRMKKSEEKGVRFSSIGVTAASPKLTWRTVKDHIENKRHNPYFEILPYLTVDGVNERGIFAQSNVVEENGVDIVNINPTSTRHCCCSIMLVRFILDNIGDIDELEPFLGTLHLYNAPRDKVAYNNHVMVSDSKGNTKIIEFLKDRFEIVDAYPVMTNFRTNGGFKLKTGSSTEIDWSSVEHNGIGLERFEQGLRFVNDGKAANLSSFEDLREQLDYTHAYDRPVSLSTWLTDNLSGDLSVIDAMKYHNGTIGSDRKDLYDGVLSGYRELYSTRSRTDGNKTWITTHGAIYDLGNLSCNLKSQMSTGEETCWNVLSDGTITQVIPKVTLTLHVEWDGETWYPIGHIEDKDGNTLPLDMPIQLEKGSSIILKARPPSTDTVEKFLRWADDEIYAEDRTVMMDSDKDLTAIFHQNVS